MRIERCLDLNVEFIFISLKIEQEIGWERDFEILEFKKWIGRKKRLKKDVVRGFGFEILFIYYLKNVENYL